MQVSAKVVPRISLPEDDIWQGGQNLATETDPRDYFWQPNLVLGTIYSNQNWSPRTTFGWDQFCYDRPRYVLTISRHCDRLGGPRVMASTGQTPAKKRCTKHELQSLAEQLQHAASIAPLAPLPLTLPSPCW